MNAHTQARKHASTQARGVGEVGVRTGAVVFTVVPFAKVSEAVQERISMYVTEEEWDREYFPGYKRA